MLIHNYISNAPINRLRKRLNDLPKNLREDLTQQPNKNLLRSVVLKNFRRTFVKHYDYFRLFFDLIIL